MATQQNKKASAQRRAELAAKQAAMARAEKRRKTAWGTGIGVLVAALVAGLVILAIHRNNTDAAVATASESSSAEVGESNLLAPAWISGLKGQEIDGVSSNQMEQLAYHIHAHLAIYINGTQKTIPYGIGIEEPWTTEADGSSEFVDSGAAFYYLHTHDDTGVIHIESPTNSLFTLGQFFAEWNQTLSSDQIGQYTGAVTTFVNGTKYTGDPSSIKLTAHEVIQLDLGKVVGFQPYTFASGL